MYQMLSDNSGFAETEMRTELQTETYMDPVVQTLRISFGQFTKRKYCHLCIRALQGPV